MMNYSVTMEAAWLVRDVRTIDDAIGIAISEAGKRFHPNLDFVDIEIGSVACAKCGKDNDAVMLVASTALVGMMLSMKVFDAESSEHAARIAKSVVGRALKGVPLRVIEVAEWSE
ncbi:MAG: DUF555 domain-containing protein [Euryarchaeota archaeon]|nr:DUF555 domain-containing protein [Euryarchaeota archaeon]